MTLKISIASLVMAVAALCLAIFRIPGPQPPLPAKETSYERVMRTKTLRCAYYVWRPFFSKDPNTGEISGVVPELFDKVAQDLGLKIEYTEEVNYAQMFEGFATNRYDAICGPVAATSSRAAVADFTAPVAYAFYNAYSRIDDHRFDGGHENIDREEVRIAVMEGEMGATVAPLKFPKAKIMAQSNIGDGASLLMQDVATGKADITLTDTSGARIFMNNNPGKLREVPGGAVALLPANIAVPKNEYALKAMLDTAFSYLNSIGYVSALLKKYGATEDIYLPDISYEKVR